MSKILLPLMSSTISAGFPSPALDYIEDTIDICDFLINHPVSTFILKVSGDSMKDKNICDGDFVVVDKALNPSVWNIVVAVLNEEFVCKELQKDPKWNIFLKAHNPLYQDLYPKDGEELVVWGIVVWKFNKVF